MFLLIRQNDKIQNIIITVLLCCIMLYFQEVLNYLVHKCTHGRLCMQGWQLYCSTVWEDTLRLLSPWWIAKCSCFKILLGHSTQLAKGCSLMYYVSWDQVCVCSSLKLCNKCTYKTRHQGFFSLPSSLSSHLCRGRGAARKLKQKKQPVTLTAASPACLVLAEQFGYAIKAYKLIAQQNNSPSLIPA